MQLSDVVKFQKALALAASASNQYEAEAAELGARRLMHSCNIDPTRVPDTSFLDDGNFAGNLLLRKLRQEWRQQHPPPPPPPPAEEKQRHYRIPNGSSVPFNIRGFRKTDKRNKKHKQRRRSGGDNSVAAAMIRKWVYEEPDISTKELEQRLQQAQQPRNFDTIGAIRSTTQRVLLELNEMGYLTEPLAARLRT